MCSHSWPGDAQKAHAQAQFEALQDVTPIVNSILQDSDGFLWFAGWEGLYRYDGHELKHFTHVSGDSTSLLSHNVNHLYEDRNGWLWVTSTGGGRVGLNRYNQ